MKKLLHRIRARNREVTENASGEVIVVSGLPRSGTSMMMKMLEAGGVPLLTDGQRRPDPDNPKGYYEFERVKDLRRGDDAWVGDATGRAVKAISELLRYLPAEFFYRVVFMRRRIEEVLASQRKMLANRGERVSTPEEDANLLELFREHVAEIESWLAAQPNMSVLHVDYSEMLADPSRQIPRIIEHLDQGLDATRMMAVVDPSLYRQRS